ncbi:Electron transport complex protein RnfD [Pelotomaculum schinkii]|uniref:Ion-translocating oxidoreductase complex subunit D n=1 Tax=Pelotomaculum schinkii TaxID=78350 RepID=A0A4Y7RGC6_9FIRM|nr:RnfABCDGE type electron transport complex subunit D [Pelotomaculum schinkii]TEB08054.1 Electron transport complex protein RnfD [Pelotomaculum schinkii]
MGRYNQGTLIVSSSPHIVDNVTTTRIMLDVLIALIPAFIMSGVIFGSRAILLTVTCVAACVLFEAGFQYITKKDSTITDLSAVVTGVLLGFNLPSSLPFWMAVVGSFVAIVVVKQIFGGIGQNFANPAITARVVLLVSFATPMTTWPLPSNLLGTTDAVTGATPLGILNMGTDLSSLPSNMDLFLGFVGGSLGETSAIALLIGGIYLLWRKVIEPWIPLAFIGTVFIFALLAGQDPIFHICAGGVMLGAFFMATDYTTSPHLTTGKIVFGIGCGLMTMIIRLYGSYPEGVSFAILLMNILTPQIDMLFRRKTYGGVKI